MKLMYSVEIMVDRKSICKRKPKEGNIYQLTALNILQVYIKKNYLLK